MKRLLIILVFLVSLNSYAQKLFNLDFEKVENGTPLEWNNFGSSDYIISLDTLHSKNGKNAATIEYNGDSPDFKAWAYTIPAQYKGQKIKLTGYLKTENVTDGWAGLWLRIDPQVAFDNMENRGVIGTTEWQKYEVELDLNPGKAKQIVFGGLLAGNGKIWIDDLSITIDGIDIAKAPLKELLPAEKDKEFDAGSAIEISMLNEKTIYDLEILGKIWGFLKYHHPEIGHGNYNWDYELFRILPEYLKNTNASKRDRLLKNWIKNLGDIPKCENCEVAAENAFLKPDHDWIENSNLSKSLKKKLYHILENRHQGNHYYIRMVPNIGNPEFINEAPYAKMPFPDDGFRLLALYKYWNMIHYFFPYKHLMDNDWNAILKTYIPKFLNAKNELEYELAAVQIIGDIQDTHANLWGGNNAINDWKGKFYPPVHVRFIEDQLVVTDYYNPKMQQKIGLKIGDVITRINGKKIDGLVREKSPVYPASNEAARLRDISADLLRSNEKEIQIMYSRGKNEKAKGLKLYERDSLNIYRWYRRDDEKSFRLLDGNIGYVTLKTIKTEDIEKIKESFIDTKGIIIDIRNYPSTFVPFSLGGYFISTPTQFVKFTAGSVNIPGQFTFTRPLVIPNQTDFYKGKLVVIVNELSQSQAEYTSMAFRAGENTTIIGSTTAGADGNVSAIHLPGGLRTMISGIGVYYPDGTETQRVGIVPDIEIKPTIEGIRNGRDELLEKAIELINKKP